MNRPMNQMVRLVQNAPRNIMKTLPFTSSGQGSAAAYYSNSGGGLNKQWVHPPDVLNHGRVEYTVKFLGEAEVQQAKGTEVIKEAIQKIRFNMQLKRSATGTSGAKLPKVELHINVDGLTIVNAKTRDTLYEYPLHRISFCADDKQDKRIFSFIAKQADSARHNCFVFLSEKLAEEITLTIGEAFDLAYRRFLDNSGKDSEAKKHSVLLRKRVAELERENAQLKQKLSRFEKYEAQLSVVSSGPKATSDQGRWESFETPPLPKTPMPTTPPQAVLNAPQPPTARRRGSNPPGADKNPNVFGAGGDQGIMNDLSANAPEVGPQLENLQLSSMDDLFDDEFDPRAGERKAAAAVPKDPFGLNPFGTNNEPTSAQNGPQTAVNGPELEPSAEDLQSAISLIDSRLAEMQEGFQRGLAFGNEDFGAKDLLGEFDPLATASNKSEEATGF